jgi:hypothetical protein
MSLPIRPVDSLYIEIGRVSSTRTDNERVILLLYIYDLEERPPRMFCFSLALVRLKIFWQPIHHLVDCLIQCVLFDNAALLSPPLLVLIPGEP